MTATERSFAKRRRSSPPTARSPGWRSRHETIHGRLIPGGLAARSTQGPIHHHRVHGASATKCPGPTPCGSESAVRPASDGDTGRQGVPGRLRRLRVPTRFAQKYTLRGTRPTQRAPTGEIVITGLPRQAPGFGSRRPDCEQICRSRESCRICRVIDDPSSVWTPGRTYLLTTCGRQSSYVRSVGCHDVQ